MKYTDQSRLLLAVDNIIFGYDEEGFKLLLIQRGFTPEKGKWSLMGGFLKKEESLIQAANRILKQLTGLSDVFMEELKVFSKPDRDPVERTIAVAYVALIDIQKYKKQMNLNFHAKWFCFNEMPALIFDHKEMVDLAINKLRYKAAQQPLLFELLPDKFTLPQLQELYECLYNTELDKRNFIRRVLSAGILEKLNEKDKENSKKGAYYFRINRKKYNNNFQSFLNFIPNAEKLVRL